MHLSNISLQQEPFRSSNQPLHFQANEYPNVFQMACIEQKNTKEEPKLAEEGSDDVQSTSDQESVVTVRGKLYIVDVRICSQEVASFSS